jgi:hypothetical protein
MEVALVMLDAVAYLADVKEVYRRVKVREIAEDRARQQALLLLFGGLQQINHNLQEQDRYNQQQRYQSSSSMSSGSSMN